VLLEAEEVVVAVVVVEVEIEEKVEEKSHKTINILKKYFANCRM
jgi:hypothetical protein